MLTVILGLIHYFCEKDFDMLYILTVIVDANLLLMLLEKL